MSPAQIIDRELSRGMRADAKLAALIVYAEPSRIQEPIGEFLMRIKCIRRETVAAWLDTAKINPWRSGDNLSREQRAALARLLTDFWKAGQS